MLEALSHRLRRRILRAFDGREREIDSAELARTVDAPLSEVNYHLGFLVEAGAVEFGETEKARGASRPLYRLAHDGRAEWVRVVLDAHRDSDDG